MNNNKNSLNLKDIKKWTKNLIVFSSPAIVAVLSALQGGASWEFAQGAGYSALLAAFIDLFKKYRADN